MAEFHGRLVDRDGNPLGTASNPLYIEGGSGGGSFILKRYFCAQSVLVATVEYEPASLPMAEGTLLGRAAGGNIGALNATQVKTMLSLTEALVYKGVIDCSSNPNYPAASTGDFYKVSVAGRIGGGSGPKVDANDSIICNTTTAGGTHAAVGDNFNILQSNIDPSLFEPADPAIQAHITSPHAPANAEANVQTDWDQADTGADDYLKNKPSSFTPSSHTHGNISNTGCVGTDTNKPLITGASGIVSAGSFGTDANTFAEGNHTHSGTYEPADPTLVRGPASAESDQIATYNGATGKLIKCSTVKATTSGDLELPFGGRILINGFALSASDVGAIPMAEKGAANGVAMLDASSKVPATELGIASSATLGAVRIGNRISIDVDGVISADEQGGGLVKVTDNDTTAGYLYGKLVAGANISLTEGNDGGNETLTVSASFSGGGDVSGPETTTENKVPQWDSTTKLLKDGLSVGTLPYNLVQLDENGKLPGLDASNLYNVPIYGAVVIEDPYSPYTLPATPATYQVLDVFGDGVTWEINANTGQYLRMGSVLSSSAGSITSAGTCDMVSLVYIPDYCGHNTWVVRYHIGELNLL